MEAGTLPKPAYPHDVDGLFALYSIFGQRGIGFVTAWNYPEPMQPGYPNRSARLTVPSGYLTWAAIDALTRWAAAGNGRDFEFANGELVLTYRWIDEEVEV